MKRVFALSLLLLSSCAVGPYQAGNYIPGRMVALSDGTLYPMQIELSYGSGKMTATNPRTGEFLDGTYTGFHETKSVQHSTPSFFGDMNRSQSLETTDNVNASAILVGNKGTVINIKMLIRPGSPPIGHGEGEDNKGKKYNIQF